MLQGVADYVVRSNRETGCGRADIQIVSFDLNKPAFILELKREDDYRQMDAQCQKALRLYIAVYPDHGSLSRLMFRNLQVHPASLQFKIIYVCPVSWD